MESKKGSLEEKLRELQKENFHDGFLFKEENIPYEFEKITSEINQKEFDKLVGKSKIIFPNLTQPQVVTSVVANIMTDNFSSGLPTLWEKLSIMIKNHYGYHSPDGHGSINATVASLREKEEKEHDFHNSYPLYK